MKQKLLRNRRTGGGQTGEMQLGEEEKIRLVLGNLVVVGHVLYLQILMRILVNVC